MAAVKYMCVYLVIFAAVFFGGADSLQCYVCRGQDCVGVSEDMVQTCPARPVPTEGPDPTTDHDMNFDQDIYSGVQLSDTPMLDEVETEVKSSGFVLDSSELPGDRFFSRRLKQFREENTVNDDGARCVIAVYQEQNGPPNVVRDCAFANDDQTAACKEAVGDNYTGDLMHCNLCDEDLCNSAARSALALVFLIAGLLVNL